MKACGAWICTNMMPREHYEMRDGKALVYDLDMVKRPVRYHQTFRYS